MTPPVTAAYRWQRRLYWRWTAPGIIFLKEGQVTVTLRSGVGFFIWDECLLHFLKVGGNYQVKLKTVSECREVGPCLLNWRGREDWQEHELQRAREKGLDLKDFPGLPSMCLVSEGMRFTPAPLSSPSSLSESSVCSQHGKKVRSWETTNRKRHTSITAKRTLTLAAVTMAASCRLGSQLRCESPVFERSRRSQGLTQHPIVTQRTFSWELLSYFCTRFLLVIFQERL